MLCGEVVDIQNIELLIQKIEKATHVSIDTETKSLEDKTLVAYSICCDGDAYFIPVAMKNLQNIPTLPHTRIMQALLNRELIYHNYAFDAQVLTKAGFPPTKLPHDTLIIAHLLNENTSHRLKDLVKTHLNYQMTTYKELCGTGKKQISFAELDGESATYYGVDDALYTYKLFMHLHNKLIQYDDLRKAYYDIERPLMLVVQDMHTQGVPVDVEKVKAIQKVCTEKMQDAYDRLQYYMKGVNLNSPIQLRDYFIGKRHQPILKRSPRTGEPSVDSEVLEKYANKCKEAGLILEYRYYAKILTTFIPALTPTLDNGGMKIYPEFSQAGTKSGRFSSSNPNGQNFPKSKDELGLRSCVKAPDGYKLIVYDYSGIEMRLVAALSNETKLIDAFNKDLDTHSEVAKDVGCSRNDAKILSYACVPLTAQALSKEGWKSYDELKEGEDILAYNPKLNRNEWTPCLKKVYYASAPVVRWEHGQGFKIESTPNHRWYGSIRRQIGHTSTSFRYYKNIIFTTEEANSECIIQRSAINESSSSLNLNKITHKYLDDNKWEQYVIQMSDEERRLWFSANIATDGHIDKRGTYHFTQSDKQIGLFNAMVLCGYLLGYTIYIHRRKKTMCNNVRFGRRQTTTMQQMKVSNVGNKPVWCVETKLGTWVMKQGDTITITGNTLYGAGAQLISKQLNCSPIEAQQYIYNYYKKYPNIRKYLSETRYKAHRQGYLSIYGGRRRNISTNFEHKSDYEKGAELRSLVNATIQGASATLLKKAMIQIHQRLQPLNAHLIMTVHDELMAIATTENAETVAQIMKEEMIAAGKEFAVKISVDGGIGNEWSNIH